MYIVASISPLMTGTAMETELILRFNTVRGYNIVLIYALVPTIEFYWEFRSNSRTRASAIN